MQDAGSLIRSLIKDLGLKGPSSLHIIRGRWAELFEGALSLHCRPEALRDGELLVNVDSPVWRQQLGFLSSGMEKKLAPFGVKRLRFRIGRVDRAGAQGAGGRPASGPAFGSREREPLSPEDLDFVRNMGSLIDDEETKQAALRAASKSLRAQKPLMADRPQAGYGP